MKYVVGTYQNLPRGDELFLFLLNERVRNTIPKSSSSSKLNVIIKSSKLPNNIQACYEDFY